MSKWTVHDFSDIFCIALYLHLCIHVYEAYGVNVTLSVSLPAGCAA